MRTNIVKPAAVAAVASLSLVLSACGSTDEAADDKQTSSNESADNDSDEMKAGQMVGAGCADYAEQVPDGDGSVEGMAADPVATAASNNPLLKTLTSAISGKLNPEVDLVDTLNGDEFTVFAPVDDAFAKLPAADVKALGTKAGAATLESILTYHVVPGQIAPSDLAGEQETVNGQTVEVTGERDNLEVGNAKVMCGGVKTANATVYLIDTVLMPQDQ